MLSEIGMGGDSSLWGSSSLPTSSRRLNLTPARFRLREERKRVIRALDAKYRAIDDHEKGMRRFVLIKNNLRRLQREAREEKLARHRAGLSGSRLSNFSPSCLSAATRPPRSPSPPCDFGYPDSPFPLSPFFDDCDEPPSKKLRLFPDDDKENEMDTNGEGPKGPPSAFRPLEDAQEILRDLYESCVNDGITARSCSSPLSLSSDEDDLSGSPYTLGSSSSSLSSSVNDSSNGSSSNSTSINGSGDGDWPRQSQYPFNCGHSSLLGNDLHSVVFHSLITSLES